MANPDVRPVPAIRRTGRPTGSVNIASRRAAKKLEELGFDPIAEMIKLHDDINTQLEEMTTAVDEDGNSRGYSQIAYSNLLSTKQKCVTELMRYGYARTPESTMGEGKPMPALQINLTGSKVEFDTSTLILREQELEVASAADPDAETPMRGPNE
jgi:hypothetical protein